MAEQAKNNVVDLVPQAELSQKAQLALERELKAFSEGLPYGRDRVIDKTQGAFKKGLMSFYEAGCGMILLHEHEDRPTLAGILEKYFPGISERSARRYRQFARTAAQTPNFRAFCESGGGWSKGLTMLEACTEAEVQEFEDEGTLRGYTRDEIARMSVRQLQAALRRAKDVREKAVNQATEKVQKENQGLTSEVEALKLLAAPQDLEAVKKIYAQAAKHLTAAARLLRGLDIALLGRDWHTRIASLAQLREARGILDHLEGEILAVEEPEIPRGEG